MKKLILIFLFLQTVVLYGQVTYPHNSLRVGDNIVKQQVKYKDLGREGDNVIWDFGGLDPINEEYSVVYSEPLLRENRYYIIGKDTFYIDQLQANTQLIIGTEHSTMYYYKQTEKEQVLLGYENPTTILTYTTPVKLYQYPFNYNDNFSGDFTSKGAYSSRNAIESKGKYAGTADAYGMMILPSKDTLQNVIRIKSVQNVDEIIKGTGNNNQTTVENYKWFVKGYRYPIFETVKTIIKGNSTGQEKEYFATAFFFPPQDHLYLDNDPDNEAVLDSLWNTEIRKVNPEIVKSIQPNSETIFNYNFYPNPVSDLLTIEYYLGTSSDIKISIYNISGGLLKTTSKMNQELGIHSDQIDFSPYVSGNYILRIEAGNNIYSDKIIKK